MKLEMEISNKPVTKIELDNIENHIGISLPLEYKEFLTCQNGGIPEKGIFTIKGKGNSGVVFLGVSANEKTMDLKWAWNVYNKRIPESYFPIGIDPGGNLILMRHAAPHSIAYWDHEQETSPASMHNVSEVSCSLKGFINSLQIDEDGEDW